MAWCDWWSLRKIQGVLAYHGFVLHGVCSLQIFLKVLSIILQKQKNDNCYLVRLGPKKPKFFVISKIHKYIKNTYIERHPNEFRFTFTQMNRYVYRQTYIPIYAFGARLPPELESPISRLERTTANFLTLPFLSYDP